MTRTRQSRSPSRISALWRSIVSHAEAAPDVYRTGYEDGTAIYTNYGSAPITVGGVTVAAKDYAAVKEGAHP